MKDKRRQRLAHRPMRTPRSLPALCAALLALAPGAHAQRPVVPEELGDPFLARWPDEPYPRNVWDMEVADGRLYFGAGNSANTGPSRNAGPVPIVSYDGKAFRTEFQVDDEQIARFYRSRGTLIVPGHDSREDWSFGNLYLLGPKGWEKRRTVPGGIHVYDVHRWGKLLVGVGGTQAQPIDAWLSDDEGRSWRAAKLLPNPDFATPANPGGVFERVIWNEAPRLWSLFALDGALYASATETLKPAGSAEQPARAILFRLDAARGGFVPVAFDPRTLTDAQRGAFADRGIRPFPGLEAVPGRAAPVVQRAVRIGDTTVYVGGWQHNDHQWLPFGLFVARAGRAWQLPLPEGTQVHDLIFTRGRLYALADRPLAGGGHAVAVLRIGVPEGRVTPLFEFERATFARSFAYYRGAFVLALGSEVRDPEAKDGAERWKSELSPLSGRILRVAWPLPR